MLVVFSHAQNEHFVARRSGVDRVDRVRLRARNSRERESFSVSRVMRLRHGTSIAPIAWDLLRARTLKEREQKGARGGVKRILPCREHQLRFTSHSGHSAGTAMVLLCSYLFWLYVHFSLFTKKNPKFLNCPLYHTCCHLYTRFLLCLLTHTDRNNLADLQK